MRTWMARFAATALLVAAGCAPTKTTATGRVTYRGKPVTWGSVVLVAADGVSYPGVLQADGSFAIPGVPAGPVRILVRNPEPRPAPPGPPRAGGRPGGPQIAVDTGDRGPAAGSGWTPIPEKYADPDRAGLLAEVRPGEPLRVELD